jgi:hypothetical protein
MDKILDPNETVIWSGKPEKKAYLLPAFGGVPFALFFLVFFYIMVTTGNPSGIEWFLPVFVLGWVIGLIVVPPLWQSRKFSGVGYMITNQRLLIKSGITEQDVWFADLGSIKETIVKIGFVDKIIGTGSLYPITAEYPYAPQPRSYSEAGMNKLKKVYNVADGKYEEITELELYRKSLHHPHLEGLNEPYAVQKLLRETIFGVGTNYVNCGYCHYRYDLNKVGKCPNCGAPKS